MDNHVRGIVELKDYGKITIKVTESKVLFYYKYNNKYITSSNNSIDNKKEYYGYPTLVNFTPDTVFDKLVAGFNKIDYNIIKMINEIGNGAEAKAYLEEFDVYVNDELEIRRGRKIYPNYIVKIRDLEICIESE